MCVMHKHIMKYDHFTKSNKTRQRGIGFFGFLIGIVVGIAVALAVAVYITKVPTPFTHKNEEKTQEEQAAKQEQEKNWNPNAALSGDSVEPPSQDEQTAKNSDEQDTTDPSTTKTDETADKKESQSVLPGWEGTVDNSTNEFAAADRKQMLEQARAEAKAKAKLEEDKARKQKQELTRAEIKANASDDPIGSLLKSHDKPKTASAKKTSSGFIYFVQVGAFRNSSGAEQQKARVSMLGMRARVNRRKRAGRDIYQVRLGPFQNKTQADVARNKLRNGGIDTALVRVQR